MIITILQVVYGTDFINVALDKQKTFESTISYAYEGAQKSVKSLFINFSVSLKTLITIVYSKYHMLF